MRRDWLPTCSIFIFPFRQILFLVDYSESCSLVASYVKDMVRHFAAELTLLHAYTANIMIPSEDEETDVEWLRRMKARQEKRVCRCIRGRTW